MTRAGAKKMSLKNVNFFQREKKHHFETAKNVQTKVYDRFIEAIIYLLFLLNVTQETIYFYWVCQGL